MSTPQNIPVITGNRHKNIKDPMITSQDIKKRIYMKPQFFKTTLLCMFAILFSISLICVSENDQYWFYIFNVAIWYIYVPRPISHACQTHLTVNAQDCSQASQDTHHNKIAFCNCRLQSVVSQPRIVENETNRWNYLAL